MENLMQPLMQMLGPDVDWKQVLLIGMSPVFLIAFAIEWRVMRGRGARAQFDWRDILANLSLGGSYQVFELGAHILITERMNFTTAMRQSLLYSITGWWLFFCPLIFLGVPPAVVFFLYAVDLCYQYFVHTESVGKLPRWIEYAFDTPSNHRVHHGRNAQYIDKNYGGVLILFDRWFGTYEEEQEQVEYGIAVRQPHSSNFLVLNFHEFADMWRDVFARGPLGLRLKHLWAPPEWTRPAPRTNYCATLPPSATRMLPLQ